MLFASLSLSILPLCGSPTLLSQPQELLSDSQLKSEIDASLRWLRSRFDLETGSYGSDDEDAIVLLAFATSPRQYRATDGPFIARPLERLLVTQKADGSLANSDITRATYAALEAMGDPATEKARAAMRPHLGSARTGNPFEGLGAEDLSINARRLLDERDGRTWRREELVAETARKLFLLGQIYAVMKANKRKKAPGEASPLPALSRVDRQALDKSFVRGADFLFDQAVDGKWGFDGHPDPGITAMVCAALAKHEGMSDVQRESLEKALDWIVSLQKPDGSIHAGQLANYVSSVAIMALARAGRPADQAVVERARAFLVKLQADEGEGYTKNDLYYGGVGYGGDERPDLSNLQIALEALAESGSEPGDETFKKALTFLQRCQNHSETNDLELTRDGVTYASGNDGGAGYAPGDSKAGFIQLRNGEKVPRSYGSMTYALLKGYLFAGLPNSDPRVEAAWKWLQENYTLDVNPGFAASSDPTAAYQGLFYYFFTMAKALDLYGEDTIVDGAGRPHAWRTELAGRLLAMQRQDGSWLNSNAARWFEGNPVLATCYALLSLDATRGARN